MIQEFSGVARVFAGDEINRFQNFQSSSRDVGEISDWRGDQIDGSEHRLIQDERKSYFRF